jgi:two-component system sensor histidine kinase/response regulator
MDGSFGIANTWSPDAVLGAIDEALGAGICVTDRNGVFVGVSRAYCHIYGYESAELIGQPFTIVVPPEAHAYAMAAHDRFLNEGLEPRGEWEVVRKGGERIVVEVGASLFHDRNGNPFKVTTVADVTERRRALQALTVSRSELARLNLEKTKLFTLLAHDLRGPFGAVLSFTELLEEQVANPERAARCARGAHSAAQQVYRLLEGLLDWAQQEMRQDALAREPVDLAVVTGGTLALLAPAAAAKEVALLNEVPPLGALGDGTALATVLRNLVANAVKFTPRGGTVTVTATLSAGAAGAMVELAVADTGTGIRPERLAQLFRLDTLRSEPGTEGEPGSGFGLQVCKDLTERMGGALHAASLPGHGSTFRVLLPAA